MKHTIYYFNLIILAWSGVFLHVLDTRKGMSYEEAILRNSIETSVDTVFLTRESTCFEERYGLYFDECATYVSTDPGLHKLCCTQQDSIGNNFILCKEFLVRGRPEEGYELVVLCEKEPFELPSGKLVDCGNYSAVILKGSPNGCDSSGFYDVNLIEPTVILEGPLCLDSEICLQAGVYFECFRITPDYYSTWVDRLSGETLATNTDVLCANQAGEYCYVIQTGYQGVLCDPKQYCVTVEELKPAPPEITGRTVRCRDTMLFYAYSYGQDTSTYEWFASDGEFVGAHDEDRILLDLSRVTSDTVQLCVGITNDCGVSDTSCINITFDTDSVKADFTVEFIGDTAYFKGNAPGATSYFWIFGNPFWTKRGKEVSRIIDEPGEYIVKLIASNNCARDTITRTIIVQPTGVFSPDQHQTLEIFPNPASESVTVKVAYAQAQSEMHRIRLIGLSGNVHLDRWVPGTMLRDGHILDVSSVPTGIYFILVEESGIFYGGRVVVAR